MFMKKALKTNVNEIIILTEDKRIYDEVIRFGGKCFIIEQECLNGTDRIIKYLDSIDHKKYDIIVNIQGDEPFIDPNIINKCINNYLEKNPSCSTICYKTKKKNLIKSKSKGKSNY